MTDNTSASIVEFEPLMLSTPALVEAYWPQVEPLFKEVCENAMHGEFNIQDLKALALHGAVSIFVVTNDKTATNPDREVKLALAVEILSYPRLPAMNVLALGGKDLRLFHKKFWNQFCGWAYMNGVRAIDGWVNPAMKRILERLGFKQVYSHMRLELTGANYEQRNNI
jgi:hypothetical protein